MDALTRHIESFGGYFRWQTGFLQVIVALVVAAIIISRFHLLNSRKRRTTRLKGPQSKSFIFGLARELFELPDIGIVYEEFEKKYGPVFEIPGVMGSNAVVLCDSKAIAHFFSKDTFKYQQPVNIRSTFTQVSIWIGKSYSKLILSVWA